MRSPTLMLVSKLIDGYLSEIASDANFSLIDSIILQFNYRSKLDSLMMAFTELQMSISRYKLPNKLFCWYNPRFNIHL